MEKIKNKNVLVVDHSEINRLELRELLQGFMNVEEAADIEKAEEILTEGKQHIDIIIQDIVFPQKSGFELLEFLRSHNEYNEIPVMVVSAETSDNFIARSFDLGAADYIRRPF
ncbi:MAG: response regulator, partial [Firmicutes bacterium]|nr:response regulator [Bacillota bacterium]